ncbi:MAG: NADPH-dependent F420 reductase [Anaerolineaceae bacterium]|nr:NADPH-dependent F420 reductase [Anaerolineaceae bacterium]
MTDYQAMSIAILGGTGKEGSGLAMRWAINGYKVIIGSRDGDRAAAYAAEMSAKLEGKPVTGMSNSEAAKQANLVVLSVPYSAHQATLEGVKEQLAGKILVDITVPLQPPKVRTVHLPEGKSAALEAQALLGEGVKVVAAFQNVSAEQLVDPNHVVDCDVLVCGNDAEARATVIKLVADTGMKGVDAGSLPNSIAVEALTPVLLWINKAYGIKGSGIRITGI